MELLMILFCEGHLCSLCPPFQRSRGAVPL